MLAVSWPLATEVKRAVVRLMTPSIFGLDASPVPANELRRMPGLSSGALSPSKKPGETVWGRFALDPQSTYFYDVCSEPPSSLSGAQPT